MLDAVSDFGGAVIGDDVSGVHVPVAAVADLQELDVAVLAGGDDDAAAGVAESRIRQAADRVVVDDGGSEDRVGSG